MWCVYLIIRDDGKQYIGKTKIETIKRRMNAHKKSKRFANYEFTYQIIAQTTTHDEVLIKEEYYIDLYNTYKDGLNATKTGKGCGHNSPNFSTLGMKFSEKHRENMRKNHWSKTGKYDQTGRKLSDETKKLISTSKKGKVSFTKLNESDVRNILLLYFSKPIFENVDKIQRNGLPLSYDRAFSNYYHKTFNISVTALRNIIQGKVKIWQPILSEITEKYKF